MWGSGQWQGTSREGFQQGRAGSHRGGQVACLKEGGTQGLKEQGRAEVRAYQGLSSAWPHGDSPPALHLLWPWPPRARKRSVGLWCAGAVARQRVCRPGSLALAELSPSVMSPLSAPKSSFDPHHRSQPSYERPSFLPPGPGLMLRQKSIGRSQRQRWRGGAGVGDRGRPRAWQVGPVHLGGWVAEPWLLSVPAVCAPMSLGPQAKWETLDGVCCVLEHRSPPAGKLWHHLHVKGTSGKRGSRGSPQGASESGTAPAPPCPCSPDTLGLRAFCALPASRCMCACVRACGCGWRAPRSGPGLETEPRRLRRSCGTHCSQLCGPCTP